MGNVRRFSQLGLCVLMAAVLLAVSVQPAHACTVISFTSMGTVVPTRSPAQLSKEVGIVLIGEVVSISGDIHPEVIIDAKQYLKGSGPRRLVFNVACGLIGYHHRISAGETWIFYMGHSRSGYGIYEVDRPDQATINLIQLNNPIPTTPVDTGNAAFLLAGGVLTIVVCSGIAVWLLRQSVKR